MSTVSLKYCDIIQQFNGESDFNEWVEKLELVAKLQKVKDLASFLPLFLSGGAFRVYQGLIDEVKDDYNMVKLSLSKAFSLDSFTAYEVLIERKMKANESVDVYLSDLKRIMNLIGNMNEDFLKCAFVTGLPEVIKSQIRAACSLNTMDLDIIVEKSRFLIKSNERLEAQACFLSVMDRKKPTIHKNQIKCYYCGEIGHKITDCKKQQHRENVKFERACFICGSKEHLVPSCPRRYSKND